MDTFLTISEAGDLLGMSISTLRRWEREGKLVPRRTIGNQRPYPLSTINPSAVRVAEADPKTVAYARVSSHDQQADLHRQAALLDQYCTTQGWTFDFITDLGSGMDYSARLYGRRSHKNKKAMDVLREAADAL